MSKSRIFDQASAGLFAAEFQADLVRVGCDVRFGSLGDISRLLRHVRFTPNSGHQSAALQCPLSANSRHRAASSITSSAATRDGEPQRPRGFQVDNGFVLGRHLPRKVGWQQESR